MRHLPLPADAGDGIIQAQCARPGWGGYSARWLAAAAAYRTARGDPWQIQPAVFSDPERIALAGLYDLRRKNGPIERIRRPPGGFPSCPMCGSSGQRSLDHALPRHRFPEFSIVPENLVPACGICNSEEKGAIYRGASSPQRFIHPYYDRWASGALWQVQFSADLDAVTFSAMPVPTLSRRRQRVVAYHVSKVLGREWLENCRRYWGNLPLLLKNRIVGPPQEATVLAELAVRLRDEIVEKDVNGWEPAFLRGVMADPRIVPYVTAQALVVRPARV